jgi:hypothetical protein
MPINFFAHQEVILCPSLLDGQDSQIHRPTMAGHL